MSVSNFLIISLIVSMYCSSSVEASRCSPRDVLAVLRIYVESSFMSPKHLFPRYLKKSSVQSIIEESSLDSLTTRDNIPLYGFFITHMRLPFSSLSMRPQRGGTDTKSLGESWSFSFSLTSFPFIKIETSPLM